MEKGKLHTSLVLMAPWLKLRWPHFMQGKLGDVVFSLGGHARLKNLGVLLIQKRKWLLGEIRKAQPEEEFPEGQDCHLKK